MSMQHTVDSAHYRPTATLANPGSSVSRAVSALIGVFRMIVTHYRIQRDIDQLKALSAETLRDIGVSRSEISSLVDEKTHGGLDRRLVLD